MEAIPCEGGMITPLYLTSGLSRTFLVSWNMHNPVTKVIAAINGYTYFEKVMSTKHVTDKTKNTTDYANMLLTSGFTHRLILTRLSEITQLILRLEALLIICIRMVFAFRKWSIYKLLSENHGPKKVLNVLYWICLICFFPGMFLIIITVGLT